MFGFRNVQNVPEQDIVDGNFPTVKSPNPEEPAALSMAIKKIGTFDIVLCGKQASDGDTAQVGPGISTHLDIPQVTYSPAC